MKCPEYLQNGKWIVHYRRPDNHPDVKEFKEICSRNPFYRIRTDEQDIPSDIIEKLERQKDPDTWKACIDKLKPLTARMFQKGQPWITMNQIRSEAEKDPYLRRFILSIDRRVRDLVKEEWLSHSYRNKDGQMIPGIYTPGKKMLSD